MTLLSWTGRTARAATPTPMSAALSAALLVGLATASGTVSAAAAANVSTIDGSYDFNGNGWTGTITVTDAEGGRPGITMAYDGRAAESDTGTWNAGTGTLTIYRPLSGGVGQNYTLYLGSHLPTSPVFGGYFTETDTGTQRYGAYADDYVPPKVARPPVTWPSAGFPLPQAVTTPSDSLPGGAPLYYFFDGNGWGGELLLNPGNPAYGVGSQVQMYYTERGGSWQILSSYSWTPRPRP
jgi:hypothetical protein